MYGKADCQMVGLCGSAGPDLGEIYEYNESIGSRSLQYTGTYGER